MVIVIIIVVVVVVEVMIGVVVVFFLCSAESLKKRLVWFTCLINSAVEPHINQRSKTHSTNTSALIGRHRRKQ